MEHGTGIASPEPCAVMARMRAEHPGDSLVFFISYRYLPLQLQDVYRKRTLASPTAPAPARTPSASSAPCRGLSMDDVFGPQLQKSGSIVRGFTVGSNRDLSLNSGLRLQLSGKIMQDVDVTAALTDENTPIQPEGTTQTLQEFDKVFVEINAKKLTATLGDFVLDLTGSEFARLSRKLQGAQRNRTVSVQHVLLGCHDGLGRGHARPLRHKAIHRHRRRAGAVHPHRTEQRARYHHHRRHGTRVHRRRTTDTRRDERLHHRLLHGRTDVHDPPADHRRIAHHGGLRIHRPAVLTVALRRTDIGGAVLRPRETLRDVCP